MKRIFELVNAKTMPIVDLGPDGVIVTINEMKSWHDIDTSKEDVDVTYIGYMQRDVADMADDILHREIGDELSKYGIESIGCYCVKDNEWMMDIQINEEAWARKGQYWKSFIEDERCQKYLERFNDNAEFDVVKYVAMAMIVEGIITEDLESSIHDDIAETVLMNIRFTEYYKAIIHHDGDCSFLSLL